MSLAEQRIVLRDLLNVRMLRIAAAAAVGEVETQAPEETQLRRRA